MTKSTNIFKQFVLVCLCLFMAFSSVSVANAAVSSEDAISPCYTVMTYNTISIKLNGIKVSCTATVRTDYSTSIKIKMELQKKESSGYETVATWIESTTGTYLAMTKTRNINILCTYRLKATYTAGSETDTAYKYLS